MARTKTSPSFLKELAEFLASRPTATEMLSFRPSRKVQILAERLLQKQNDGEITFEESQQLDEFAHCERLLRLIKARLHAHGAPSP